MYKKFLKKKGKHICFLNSVSKEGWQPVLAWDPDEVFQGPIKNLDAFLKRHKNKLIIGYFSYDLGYSLHKIKQTAKDDLKLPKIYLLAFSNYETGKREIPAKVSDTKKDFNPVIKKENYQKNYQQIKKHISDGDIYQINYTHRLQGKTNFNPRELFLRMSAKNPVDHLAYIEGKGFEILSASPERFIKTKAGKISTFPIKGTSLSKQTLKNSPKEKAELNMITDLLRNDLGKIAKAGTVEVQKQRCIKKYPSVWHTFSIISAKLKTTPVKALLSMLPGGSVTGCPKKRAMQIIDKLEPTTRSVYCGVIGLIMPGQEEIDFSVAIRTIIKKGNDAYLQVGGGIVHDSKKEAELQETFDKAKSFMGIL